MKIEVSVSSGGSQCRRTAIIEVDDDQDDNMIDELAKDKIFEMINWNWKRMEKKP